MVGISVEKHCSVLKLDCEKYCHSDCSYESEKVVCKLINSFCNIIGCCHHDD
ncbi:hypothetical protein Mgra_00008308 [Meloidogyne graminicola]|uniref:Uncharacterized protein n=1 Tax=Meloidogyne graminicola TaxID=189291 RepID=A0A8S9ZGA7_9BILA|nr:hypothetical protein Mgra_00008308 [Meloidogyne graminicola]